MDSALIDSLEKLLAQAREALGPEHPSTLMLRQQLDAALAPRTAPARVLWLKPAPMPAPAPDD